MELERTVSKLQDNVDELKALINQSSKPTTPSQEPRPALSFATIGAMVISVVILVYFGVMLYIATTMEFPPSQKDNVSGLLWTLNTLAVAVVGYWVGSSVGSNQKTQIMDMMSKK